MKKKILVFTGSRADYGLLKPLINQISAAKKLQLKLVVSGQHYSKAHGSTYKEIISDNFKISYLSKLLSQGKKENKILHYIGKAIDEFSTYLVKKKPDLVVLLGDRYEVFSFCICCYFLNIPIVHIHGGEVTNGAFDEGLRHSISKMSNFHFTCHKKYTQRVVNLGENPKFIFNFGSLGVENALKVKIIDKMSLYARYSIPKSKKCFLVTYHPETKKEGGLKKEIDIFLSAINEFKDDYFIFTYSNSDPSGKYYIKKILNFKKNKKNIKVVPSMGSKIYLSFLKHCDLIIGNSSSGIIEAPILRTPTINVGKRQDGREYSRSIYNCENEKLKIINLINKISKKKVKTNYDKIFYKKDTAKKMFKQLLIIIKNLNQYTYKKNFYEKK